ncbi:MAG: hypothetical protein N2Z21_01705 [Candidatus Sumerlaeaceae bacterium]|nr:hypothetical protein [Candidatus Sumerlaeaceae bacterium]
MSHLQNSREDSGGESPVWAKTLVLDYLSEKATVDAPKRFWQILARPIVIVSLRRTSTLAGWLEETNHLALTSAESSALPQASHPFAFLLGMEGEEWKKARHKSSSHDSKARERFNKINNPAPVLRQHLEHCVGTLENVVLFCDLDSTMGAVEELVEILVEHLRGVVRLFLPQRVAVAVTHNHRQFRVGAYVLTELILKTGGLYDVVWSKPELGGIVEMSEYRRHALLQRSLGREKDPKVFLRRFPFLDDDEADE